MKIDAPRGREAADALEHAPLGIRQVVDDRQLVAGLGEHDAGVRADVPQPAGDEDHSVKMGSVPIFASFLRGMCRSHLCTSFGSENSVSSSARASASVCSTDSTTPCSTPLRSVANSSRMPNGSNRYADQKRPPSGPGPVTATPQPST